MPIGIILDAIFPLTTYRPHYRDRIMLSIVGEGDEQYITKESSDGSGFAFYVSRIGYEDASPIFWTNMFNQRYLHVSFFNPADGDYWAEQADPWRPMLSKYFKNNGYDEKYVQAVLQPDMYRDNTIWIGIWANGLVIGIVLYAAWRVCKSAVATYKLGLYQKYGHCQKCGYDLTHADHKVCPECGAPNH